MCSRPQSDGEITQDFLTELMKDGTVWIKNFRDENIELGKAERASQSKTYKFNTYGESDAMEVSTNWVKFNDDGFKDSEKWVATFSTMVDLSQGIRRMRPIFTISCLRDLTDTEIAFTHHSTSIFIEGLFNLVEQGVKKPEEIIWGDSKTKNIRFTGI